MLVRIASIIATSIILGGYTLTAAADPNTLIRADKLIGVRTAENGSRIFVFRDAPQQLYQVVISRDGALFALERPMTAAEKKWSLDMIQGEHVFRRVTLLTPDTIEMSHERLVFKFSNYDSDTGTTVEETKKIVDLEDLRARREGNKLSIKFGGSEIQIRLSEEFEEEFGSKSFEDHVRAVRNEYQSLREAFEGTRRQVLVLRGAEHLVRFYVAEQLVEGKSVTLEQARKDLGLPNSDQGRALLAQASSPEFYLRALRDGKPIQGRVVVTHGQMKIFDPGTGHNAPDELVLQARGSRAMGAFVWTTENRGAPGPEFTAKKERETYLPESMARAFEQVFPTLTVSHRAERELFVRASHQAQALTLREYFEAMVALPLEQARILQHGSDRFVLFPESEGRVFFVNLDLPLGASQSLKEQIQGWGSRLGIVATQGGVYHGDTDGFLSHLVADSGAACDNLKTPRGYLSDESAQKAAVRSQVAEFISRYGDTLELARTRDDVRQMLGRLSAREKEGLVSKVVEWVWESDFLPIRRDLGSRKKVALDLPVQAMRVRSTRAGSFEEIEFVTLGQQLRFQVPFSVYDPSVKKQIQFGLFYDSEFANKSPCAADSCAGRDEALEIKTKALLRPIHHPRFGATEVRLTQPSTSDVSDPEPWRESLELPAEFQSSTNPAETEYRIRDIVEFVNALPRDAKHLVRFKVLLELQGLAPADQVALVTNLIQGQRVGAGKPDAIRSLLFPNSSRLSEAEVVSGFMEYVRMSGLSARGFAYAMTANGGKISPCEFSLINRQ